jgi:hypothetical protein
MPNRNYQAGRRMEWECQKRWERKGWKTARSAGSHGEWDVTAVKSGEKVALIQCKVVNNRAIADRLIRDFEEAHPFLDDHFDLILEVRVKGSKKILHSV